MNYAASKPEITRTIERVREFSFEEKKEAALDEQKVNRFLDTIIAFKKLLSNKSTKINHLVEQIESITWFDDLDKESLMLVNDLISSIRDLRYSLLRQYVTMRYIRTKGIAKVETKNFKNAIDDLEEMANDLESRFFFLPSMPDFQETTKAYAERNCSLEATG